MSESIEIKFPLPTNTWQFKGYIEWPIGSGKNIGTVWFHRIMPHLKVMRSQAQLVDGSKWVHIVISRAERFPSMEEIAKAKIDFFGFEREAYVPIPNPRISAPYEFLVHAWSPLTGQRVIADVSDIATEEAL